MREQERDPGGPNHIASASVQGSKGIGFKPPAQLKGEAGSHPGVEPAHQPQPVIQKYDVDNLGNVNTLLLSPNQKKLYSSLKMYVDEMAYIENLGARAQVIAEDNPQLARDIRAKKLTVRNELTDLKKYIDKIPDILGMLSGNALDLAEQAAGQYAEHIRGTLVTIQEQLVSIAFPSRKFDEFMGDDDRLDEYQTGDSENTAIPVVWYKSTADYPKIKLAKADKDGKTDFTFPDGPTLDFGNVEYELSGCDDGVLDEGETFKNHHLFDDRGRQQKVRKALQHYGCNLDGKDIDHVHDLGFGGKDEDDNLWPLDATINRRPWSGWRALYGVNYLKKNNEGKTSTISALQNKWFKIKGHMKAGDGAVPAEGKRPDEDSGLE